MTSEQAVNQNISFYPTDLAIVEAVQKRNGQSLSGAVRFILREWARTSGLHETLPKDSPSQTLSKPRTIKPPARKRARANKIDQIPGVRKGLERAA